MRIRSLLFVRYNVQHKQGKLNGFVSKLKHFHRVLI